MPALEGMDRNWVGLDTGDQTTALCVTDAVGRVILQQELPSKVNAIHSALDALNSVLPFSIAMESCSTSTALAKGLRKLGYHVAVFDCYQIHQFLSIRRNKTDANDARGIAEVGRLGSGYLSQVHVKSNESYLLRAKLVTRQRIIRQRVACENLVRGLLRVYGGRIRTRIGTADLLRSHVAKQVVDIQQTSGVDLSGELAPLLDMCSRFHTEVDRLEAEIQAYADADEHCRRFRAVPGVSALVAVSFYTAIGDPMRFRRSADVPAYLGLTPKVSDSGATSKGRGISKAGSVLTRTHLVNAATVILHHSKTDTALRRWGLNKAAAIGVRKARVAVARKLAIILFNMWRNAEAFDANGLETAFSD